MISSLRAFKSASQSSPPMPPVPGFEALYDQGVTLRQGQLVMVAGRPGHMKSALAMWLCLKWEQPTLYFSADMSAYDATMRIASMITGYSREHLEEHPELAKHADHIRWSFGSPITLDRIMLELEAWAEMYSGMPSVIVIDNLQDMEAAASEYAAQVDTMLRLTELCRASGAMVIVLHHATEGSVRAQSEPFAPPARKDILNKLSSKPELVLTTAIAASGDELGVACVKQRSGPADPEARSWARIPMIPHLPSFGEKK